MSDIAGAIREAERRFPSYWARRHYYVPTETDSALIKLAPFQAAVLDFAFARKAGRLQYDTILISQPKKSGKSTMAGLIGRWASETWGQFGQVLYVGNDLAQAAGRGFALHRQSIELTPGYDRHKSLLPERWHIQSVIMKCLTTGTECKAIATDYKGEAGANPILTIWEELWGFVHTDALRFWAEIAPSPALPDSVRLIVTYAGYEGESELLWNLYSATVKEGRQLTVKDVRKATGAFAEATTPDSPIPLYVNEAKRMLAFWDSGEQARRMPWQQGARGKDYYASEAGSQTQQQFRRLHLNEWVSGESEFVPIEWWDACQKEALTLTPGDQTPMVIALDAAVTGDCFGLTMGSRDPLDSGNVAVRLARKWTPPPGGAISFSEPRETLLALCRDFNVVEVCYDSYQLVSFVQDLHGTVHFRAFSQGQERAAADKQLYDLIAHRRIRHNGEVELREHVQNCAAKYSRDEDSKLRLVKKAENRKIDLAVCLSMMSAEILRLNL